MKKYILLFLIAIHCFFGFAQIKNLTIQYGLIIGEDENIQDKNSGLSEYYKSAVDNAKHKTFTLFYSNNISLFTDNEVMELEKNTNSFSKAFSGFYGSIYIDYKNKLSYTSMNDLGLGKYCLQDTITKLDWSLTNETKTIEGFLCYKATTIDEVINQKEGFKFTITAWYCPKIPVSIGPLYLNGLPGLILETERRNVVFGAKKIIINAENATEITKPDIRNLKTKDEVKKLIDEFVTSLED
jgi:GLPGLI family protein